VITDTPLAAFRAVDFIIAGYPVVPVGVYDVRMARNARELRVSCWIAVDSAEDGQGVRCMLKRHVRGRRCHVCGALAGELCSWEKHGQKAVLGGLWGTTYAGNMDGCR
jgi:hypothetical protein